MSVFTDGNVETIEDIIDAPYIECPICKKQTYGILHVGVGAYLRACATCYIKDGKLIRKPEIFGLPKLDKKVIYLDQNIISNIAKAFNPELRRVTMDAATEEMWKKLFFKLDRLRKLRLILCPFSELHRRESFVAEDHLRLSLKALYKRLSNFVEFGESMDITAAQAYQFARHHLDQSEPSFIADPELVTIGTINSWERASLTSVMTDYDWKPEYRGMLIAQNEQSQNKFQEIFDQWIADKMPLDDRHVKESTGFGSEIRRLYALYLVKQSQLPIPPEMEKQVAELWDQHPYIELIDSVYDLFSSGSHVTNPLILRQTIDFLAGEETQQNVPALHIEPLLWATVSKYAIAEKGARTTFKPGDSNDIAAIGMVLPYCDAIVIDNAWKAELSMEPAKSEFAKYGTVLFSAKQNQIPNLMEYLEKIESNAPPEIIKAVTEVYGDIHDEDPLNEISMKLYSQPITKSPDPKSTSV